MNSSFYLNLPGYAGLSRELRWAMMLSRKWHLATMPREISYTYDYLHHSLDLVEPVLVERFHRGGPVPQSELRSVLRSIRFRNANSSSSTLVGRRPAFHELAEVVGLTHINSFVPIETAVDLYRLTRKARHMVRYGFAFDGDSMCPVAVTESGKLLLVKDGVIYYLEAVPLDLEVLPGIEFAKAARANITSSLVSSIYIYEIPLRYRYARPSVSPGKYYDLVLHLLMFWVTYSNLPFRELLFQDQFVWHVGDRFYRLRVSSKPAKDFENCLKDADLVSFAALDAIGLAKRIFPPDAAREVDQQLLPVAKRAMRIMQALVCHDGKETSQEGRS